MITENGTTTSYLIPDFHAEILWTMMPFIVLMNFFVVLTIVRTPSLHIAANCFVVAMACCDLFAGLVNLPLFITKKDSREGQYLIAIGALTMMTFMTSVGFNCACTYDRYLAVVHALRYQQLISKRKACLLIGIILLIALLITLIPFIWVDLKTYSIPASHFTSMRTYVGFTSFLIVVATLSQMVVYVSLFMIARRHAKKMRLAQHLRPRALPEQNRVCIHKRLRMMMDNMRLVKSFMLVSVTFFFFWLPIGYINIVHDVLLKPKFVPVVLKEISFYSEFISCILHPILYGLFQKRLRKSLFWFLPKNKQAPTTDFNSNFSRTTNNCNSCATKKKRSTLAMSTYQTASSVI